MFAFLSGIRKWALRTVSGLSLFVLVACQAGSMVGRGPFVDTSKPIPVALLVPHGSGQAADQALARNLENAARLAIADLDGVRIDLRIYGTAGDPARAAAVTEEALQDGAKIILGPLYAEAANAVGLQAASRGVNVLAFSNNTDIAGGNLFLLGSTFQNAAERLVGYAASRGRDRITVAYSDSPAGDVGRRAIEQAIARSSVALAGAVGYQLSQQGIIDAMPQIAQTARANGANAVFLTADVNIDLPFLAQLLPENGVDPAAVQYMGLTRWDGRPQLYNLAGVQNGWFTVPDRTRYSQFVGRYSSVYGAQPHPLAGLAYDGIAAVGALAKIGGSRALSASSITQGAGFAGVYGSFRLRPDGTNQRALAVATIINDQVQILDPAPRGFSGTGS